MTTGKTIVGKTGIETKKQRGLRRFLNAVTVGLAALAIAGCAATGGPLGLTKDQQLALGQREHPKLVSAFGGEIDDPELKAYVDGIVARLMAASDRPGEPIKTTVLDSPVVNAMALPGHIYVTRGLLALANSEAELAGVLGHEIGHIFEQHTAERVSRTNMAGIGGTLAAIGAAILTGDARMAQATQQVVGTGAQLYLLRFSRTQEYEADQVGVRLLAQAGYDPIGEADFLSTLNNWSQLEARVSGQDARPPEFLATHPNTAERVRRAAQEAQVLGLGGEVRRPPYLRAIDDMLYGDDPRMQGFIRENAFYHPSLNLGFAVPKGMQLRNTPQAVTARSQNAQMQFLGASSQNGPSALIAQLGQQMQIQFSRPRTYDANGKPGAFARARGNTRNGPVDVQAFAVQWNGASHFLFLWTTPVRATADMQRAIEQSALSLRELDGERLQIPPTRRVDIVTVQRGDTAQSLGGLSGFENAKAERFSVINALGPENPLRAGQKVKLVR